MNSYRQDKSYYAVGIRHTRPRAKPTLSARDGGIKTRSPAIGFSTTARKNSARACRIVTKVKRFAFGKIRIFWWGQLPGAELW